MSLGLIPALVIIATIYAFLMLLAMLAVPLVGSDEMDETATGTIRAVDVRMMPDAEGNMLAWLAYDVETATEGDGDESGRPSGFSVWCPDWYGPLREGDSVTVAYDSSNPSSCMMADMREECISLLPKAVRVTGAVLIGATGVLLALLALGMA